MIEEKQEKQQPCSCKGKKAAGCDGFGNTSMGFCAEYRSNRSIVPKKQIINTAWAFD